MDDLKESTKQGMRDYMMRIANNQALVPMIESMFGGVVWNLLSGCKEEYESSLTSPAQNEANRILEQLRNINDGVQSESTNLSEAYKEGCVFGYH